MNWEDPLLNTEQEQYFNNFLNAFLVDANQLDSVQTTINHPSIALEPLNADKLNLQNCNEFSYRDISAPISANSSVTSFGAEKELYLQPSSVASVKNTLNTTQKAAPKRKKAKITPKPADKSLLTEEEKKHNHVISEQRRRQAIRDGFDEIVSITPALCVRPVSAGPGNTGGGHSKSTILNAAIAYIKELQESVALLESENRNLRNSTLLPSLPLTAENNLEALLPNLRKEDAPESFLNCR